MAVAAPHHPRARGGTRTLRRQAILDAAEALIREHRATDFSMLALAERAGTSPATPYNAFGGKASILYALLGRSLETIFVDFDRLASTMRPMEVVLAAARAAADFFIADADYFRPLYGHLIGVSDPVYRPAWLETAQGYWRSALAALDRAGPPHDAAELDLLARSMMILFLGTLDLWVQGELDHDGFRAHVLYGVASILVGQASERDRALLARTRAAARQSLPGDFTLRRS